MAASICGCSSRSDLGEVAGKVTLDGEPLADASLQFVPVGAGTISFGKTDEEGNYRMVFSSADDGAMIGESIVRISTFDVYDDGGRERQKPELVPPRYNRNSELKVTVESGTNVFNFDLKSQGDE